MRRSFNMIHSHTIIQNTKTKARDLTTSTTTSINMPQ